MSKSGKLNTYLSLRIKRDADGVLHVDQNQYIDQFRTTPLQPNSKPAKNPCNTNFSELTKEETEPVMFCPYWQLVGMLQCIANGPHPDIQFAVERLSQFLPCPTENHWNPANHVLIYLHATRHLWLRLGSKNLRYLRGQSDTYWVSTVGDQWSTTGGFFRYAGGSNQLEIKMSIYDSLVHHWGWVHGNVRHRKWRDCLKILETNLKQQSSALTIREPDVSHQRKVYIEGPNISMSDTISFETVSCLVRSMLLTFPPLKC